MGRKFCHSTKCLILYHFVLCTWCCFTNHFRRLYIYDLLKFTNIHLPVYLDAARSVDWISESTFCVVAGTASFKMAGTEKKIKIE